MKKRLQISPFDPILVRDGKPFDALPGIRAHTLNDIMPSTLAGALRTMLIKTEPNSKRKSELKKLDIRGPLYRMNGSFYFAVPQDIEFYEKNAPGTVGVYQVNPVDIKQTPYKESGFLGVGKESRLEDKLWLPIGSGQHKKLENSPAYVSETWMLNWLVGSIKVKDCAEQVSQWLGWGQTETSELKGKKEDAHGYFLPPFKKEERTHTSISPESYSSKDKELFSIESLVFPQNMKLEVCMELPEEPIDREPKRISELHPLGGKRRLAHFSEVAEHAEEASFWSCPKKINVALKGKKYIRMVLATPAYFRKGWIPGWLDENLISKKSWNGNVQLQLRWACISRSQPVSGWAYDSDKGPQEKMVRRMVPAGSVYFFEVLDGDPADLAELLWLQSVSDRNRRAEAHDREDGFGLALWGSWDAAESGPGES